MVSNVSIGTTVWVMKDNEPKEAFIAEINKRENADGESITYGVHWDEAQVGKNAAKSYYAPERLYASKMELRTAVFGS